MNASASLDGLNQEQRLSVTLEDNMNALILAGAGSGKTRVLTHKIAHLIEEGLFKPEEILAVTFTNKAAEEMSNRVIALLNQKNVPLNIGTFHSICSRLLRKEIHRLGFSKDFVIYDVQDQIALIRVVMDELNIARSFVDPRTVSNNISHYKNKMLNADAAKKSARTISMITVTIYKIRKCFSNISSY